MAKREQFLTTKEFASRAGISASSVARLIKDGKLKAEKKSGKWLIDPGQLNAKSVKALNSPPKPAAGKKANAKKPTPPKKDKPAQKKQADAKTYSLTEFVAMTYLTEFGVKEWLKQGRLSGRQGAGGQWEIDAANLDLPDVKRLIR
jgi:excisionase family DNA binding protein